MVDRLAERADVNGYSAQILTTASTTSDGGRAVRAAFPDAIVLPSQFAATIGSGYRQVAESVSAADILHLHTMWSPLVAVAARIAQLRRKPYILSPHGMLDPWSMGQKRLKKRLYLALVERRTIRGAARMLFTAEDERRLAEAVTGHRTSAVIALGADRPPDSPGALRAEFRAAHPDLAMRRLVIFLGRLHAKKRPEAALRAMARLRDTHPEACLLIAGSGEAEADLRALTCELGLADHVRFLGYLAGRAKWQAFAAAEAFVLPSRQENFAIALAEALHAGVPALITRKVNIWREVVTAGAGAVLDEEALEVSLESGILRYFHHPQEQKKASEAAQLLARGSFDWSISARLTHDLYNEVLSA